MHYRTPLLLSFLIWKAVVEDGTQADGTSFLSTVNVVRKALRNYKKMTVSNLNSLLFSTFVPSVFVPVDVPFFFPGKIPRTGYMGGFKKVQESRTLFEEKNFYSKRMQDFCLPAVPQAQLVPHPSFECRVFSWFSPGFLVPHYVFGTFPHFAPVV